MQKASYLSWLTLIIVASLYFLWPTVHTIALVKLLILSAAILGGFALYGSCDRSVLLGASWVKYAVLLILWVLIHVIVLSENGNEAWREFFGQWLPAYLAMLAGIGCALAGRYFSVRAFKWYIWLIFAAQPIVYLFLTLNLAIQTGTLPVGYWGLSDHKLSITFYAEILAAMSYASLIASLQVSRTSIMPYLWLLPVILAFYAAIVADSTNGAILIAGGLFFAVSRILWQSRHSSSYGIAAAALVLILLSVYALSFSSVQTSKWRHLFSDFKVAVDISKYPNWKNIKKFGLPENDQHIRVKENTYLRMAYATAGLHTIAAYPWGYGITRHAFERLIQKEYPDAAIANSHNAYIDLICAAGFPAFILFMLLLRSAFKQYLQSENEWSRPALWIIGIIVVHWLIDPISRDHYFETLLFLIGLFGTLTLRNQAGSSLKS